MTDLPPDAGDDTGVPDRGSTTGTPLWVKLFGIIALALVLLFVILMLFGRHGPGRHTGFGGHAPPSSITDDGVQQP